MSKKRVLVCDDDLGVTEVIQIILEENGYDVKIMQNGKGIEKKVLDYKPDIILLDIWMPGIGGKEITKLIKQSPTINHIPIIIASALNDASKISEEIGAQGYLPKPFELNHLLELIKKHTE